MSDISTERGAHAAALASLPKAGPSRLHRLLRGSDPVVAWAQVCSGSVPAHVADDELRRSWAEAAAQTSIDAIGEVLEALDAWVTTPRHRLHPARLTQDIDPSPVIFRQGLPVETFAPAVTIVGTRRCSPTGKSVAFELGAGLAEAGVSVVSGLALGIDGAAHRGALSVTGAAPVGTGAASVGAGAASVGVGAAPVGVVGSGLNVVYPRANADLWRAMCQTGTLLSETPLGGNPEPWRFPARNRLLAGLSDVVVVVESKRSGGSMLTVEQAVRRGVTVMAVPGSVRNPASVGTNLLISEGCAPACSVDDVLTAVSLSTAGAGVAAAESVEPGRAGLGTVSLSADRVGVEAAESVEPGRAGLGTVGLGATGVGVAAADACVDEHGEGREADAAQIARERHQHIEATPHHPVDAPSSTGVALGELGEAPVRSGEKGEGSGVALGELGEGSVRSGEKGEGSGVALGEMHQRVLDAIDDNPVSIDRLVLRVGAAAPAVLAAVVDLEARGLLARFGAHLMRA